ncbi:DUF4435 domain-containing protein [Sulfuricurvum sp.]|uniref:DUF4435 domain-containing protein n=1 Tax=Sulfuricurvum sp. TaxID=2025608 RepID=UPI002626976D|nr:DUF4435 domain-containing protein [Sulfuricurvum sp.]MDD4950893.1 DUF4435 domain-containing protein [Sulfuricurvum sp.]
MSLCSMVKSSGEIIAEIKMNKTAFDGAYLLVEGTTDSTFWNLHIDKQLCQIIVCGQKNAVISAVNELDKLDICTQLGIVDDDFDSICTISYSSVNLLKTDANDLEISLLQSVALSKVLSVHGVESKIKIFEESHHIAIEEHLLSLSKNFGKLRLYNKVNSLGFNFITNLSPARFIDEQNWSWKTTSNEPLEVFSSCIGKSIEEIQVSIDSLCNAINDWNLVQGHDTMKILSIGFKTVLSNQVSEDTLTKALILSYDKEIFQQTDLYANIKKWESTNSINILTA